VYVFISISFLVLIWDRALIYRIIVLGELISDTDMLLLRILVSFFTTVRVLSPALLATGISQKGFSVRGAPSQN
jgi:hypothetical protein